MSELTARQSIQSTAQDASIFDDEDVVINDWTILTQANAQGKAPFLIIMGSQDFVTRSPMSGPETTWSIEVELIESWKDNWNTTLENFLSSRQSLLDAFNSGSARSPSGSDYYNIAEIRNNGEIMMYEQGDLTYFRQTIIFETELWE